MGKSYLVHMLSLTQTLDGEVRSTYRLLIRVILSISVSYIYAQRSIHQDSSTTAAVVPLVPIALVCTW